MGITTNCVEETTEVCFLIYKGARQCDCQKDYYWNRNTRIRTRSKFVRVHQIDKRYDDEGRHYDTGNCRPSPWNGEPKTTSRTIAIDGHPYDCSDRQSGNDPSNSWSNI